MKIRIKAGIKARPRSLEAEGCLNATMVVLLVKKRPDWTGSSKVLIALMLTEHAEDMSFQSWPRQV